MKNKNFFQYVQTLKDLPMFLALGYVSPQHGQKIDKFARAELQNNILATVSSFNEGISATTFKPFNDSLEDLFIQSNNVSDTHEVTIYYVNGDKDLKEQTVALRGTTQVNISTLFSDTIHCVWRMRNLSATDNIGAISIVNTSGDIFCNMLTTSGIPSNSSLTGVFSIPKGYIGLITDASISLDKGADAKGAMFARREGQTFIYQKALANFQSQSIYKDIFLVVDEKTDLLPVAIAQTGGVLYLDYQILLLKREYVGQNFKGNS